MSVRLLFSGVSARGRQVLAAAVLGLCAFAALAVSTPRTAPPDPIPVVASFSVLGDMVKEVGGDHVKLTTIVGLGGDAHSFEPTPEHARALAEAKVLVVNGLGFEEWLPRLTEAANFEGETVVAAVGIKPRFLEHGHDHGHAHGSEKAGAHGQAQAPSKAQTQKNGQAQSKAGAQPHSHSGGKSQVAVKGADSAAAANQQDKAEHRGEVDPHAWQSLTNGIIYVRNIAAGLSKADPKNASVYAERAERYIGEMTKLDAEVRHALGQIAPEKRKVVVPHDSLGYFGQDYGIEFIPIMGISGQAEASAKEVAAVIDQVRAAGTVAIFVESAANPKLAEQVARETGATIGGTLYVDTLAESDQPAGNYLGMIKWNAGQMIYVLKGQKQ